LSINYILIGYRSIVSPVLHEPVTRLYKISLTRLTINEYGYLL